MIEELARGEDPSAAEPWSMPVLVRRAARLAQPGRRSILGVAGAPGAGKSTLAAQLVAALDGQAVLVPMDGFHLGDAELERLGRRQRKGAIDTFDAAGYVNLLRRLLIRVDEVVYAPVFHREQEAAIAGELRIPRDVPLVITEGNYLLADGAFAPVRDLLTECWYLDLDRTARVARLIARHVEHGKPPDAAEQWVLGSDERNARLIEATRERADLVLRAVTASRATSWRAG